MFVLLSSFGRFAGMVKVRLCRLRKNAQRLHITFAGNLFRFNLQQIVVVHLQSKQKPLDQTRT